MVKCLCTVSNDYCILQQWFMTSAYGSLSSLPLNVYKISPCHRKSMTPSVGVEIIWKWNCGKVCFVAHPWLLLITALDTCYCVLCLSSGTWFLDEEDQQEWLPGGKSGYTSMKSTTLTIQIELVKKMLNHLFLRLLHFFQFFRLLCLASDGFIYTLLVYMVFSKRAWIATKKRLIVGFLSEMCILLHLDN